MLVLSRRSDEKIVFPGLGITVKILQIKGHQVKIGIDAPPAVVILRQELEQGSFHLEEADDDLVPLPRKG
jgi:carbon storage regulator CsrA